MHLGIVRSTNTRQSFRIHTLGLRMGHEHSPRVQYIPIMPSSYLHTIMPGSLNFDSTLAPKLDINVGARTHFFQPPRTPSASSSLHRSTPSTNTQDASNTASRKRTRHDSPASDQTISNSERSHAWYPPASDGSAVLSPAPFVNTKYELAGGLDTPTAAALSVMDLGEENCRASPELHLRGGRGFRGFEHASDSYFPRNTIALMRESNGRSRIPASPRITNSLGKAVYSVVGAAGRVLEFCRATAFRGFYAGGGKWYEMKTPSRDVNGEQSIWLDVENDNVIFHCEQEKGLVPGRFPDEDYIPDYMSHDHTTPPRGAKRIRRDKGIGEVSTSWVMVENTPVSRETSPTRLSHRKLPSATTPGRKTTVKLGRRPILPASRPSLTSYAGSPGLRSDRPASFASTRSPITSPRRESPVNADVQRHAARMRKRELEEDANLKRFNLQLKAMIKEGKEALGTKFEVEDEPVDEGYVEGEYFYDRGKG